VDIANKFDFGESLIPAIVQDYKTGEVLMLGYVNEESLRLTMETGFIHFYSRKRKKIWKKGETSGNFLKLIEIRYDCDEDAFLFLAESFGSVCHTGNKTCFHSLLYKNQEVKGTFLILEELYALILSRKSNPLEKSYTSYLFEKGLDKILKKLGEEVSEIIIAAKNDSNEEIIYEISDFIYHLLVLMAEKNITLADVYSQLGSRRK